MTDRKIQLYTFWRSQAAYRIRIALAIKGLDFEPHTIDLLKGEQFSPEYRKINPEAVVPTLIDGDGPLLFQSLAILEYLEEKYPKPSILPATPEDRAHARAIAQIAAADAHPLIIPRVRNYLGKTLGIAEPDIIEWIRHWMDTASDAIEHTLARDPRTGRFCVGDTPTIADLCLVPHFASSITIYKNDTTRWPTAHRIFEACMQEKVFAETHPLRQPDAGSAGH